MNRFELRYSYFGARYYDSDLSVWLSVDPMSDEYPSTSPFMYCAGNPVMLIDPDGRLFTDFVNKETGETKHVDDGVDQIIAVSDQDFNQIDYAWYEQQSKDAPAGARLYRVPSPSETENINIKL